MKDYSMRGMVVEDFRVLSREYIATLDRERLGRWAVPLDALIVDDASSRIQSMMGRMENRVDPSESHKHIEIHAEHHDDYKNLQLPPGVTFDDVSTEVYFWWSYFDEPLLESYKRNTFSRDRICQLLSIYENQHMHDYFAAEIWSEEFITRCIDNGIGAEVAARMWVTAEGILSEYTDRDFFVGYEMHYDRADVVAFLVKMADNPLILPYYEVGIRDDDFIRNCILNDIDPEVARSLV